MNSNDKVIKLITVVLVAIIIWMLFLTFQGGSINKITSSDIGIRMSNGYVQWKHNKDDEWSNLASSEELTGIKGDTGAQGAKGDTGEAGVQGPKGDTGAQGVQGETGPKGADGETIKIRKTATSIEWSYVDKDEWTSINDIADLKGEKGDKGDKGDTGIQGVQGIQGIPGIVGPKGDTGSQGSQGIQGLQGIQGIKGETGPSNSLTVGTVTTGSPAVSIVGTSPNQTINFAFPSVPKGGVAGQLLTKSSATDYDTKWIDNNELYGTGMPNGNVTATSGVYYTDRDGTNGAWRWIKTTNTGNTGWKVVYGDTGWIDIAKYFNPALSVTGGQKVIKIRRVNDISMVQFHGTLKNSGQVVITPANVLQGFVFASRRDIPGATTITMQVSSNNITIYGGINKKDSSVNHLDSMSFTDAPWPTNLADF